MDNKYKGLVLKLSDYKEADKLASIFTLEEGIITAKFTGVKKDKAKLKSAAQPFVLAEFTLNTKGGLHIVTSADVLDNFFNIMSDYNKTICGYIILDIIKSIVPVGKVEQDLFLLTLSSLKNIEENNEYVATADFILKFISFSGMQVSFIDLSHIYLDTDSGEFVSVRQPNSVEIDKKVYLTLKSINENQYFDFNLSTLKKVLKLLHNILYIKFDIDVKSFEFI